MVLDTRKTAKGADALGISCCEQEVQDGISSLCEVIDEVLFWGLWGLRIRDFRRIKKVLMIIL